MRNIWTQILDIHLQLWRNLIYSRCLYGLILDNALFNTFAWGFGDECMNKEKIGLDITAPHIWDKCLSVTKMHNIWNFWSCIKMPRFLLPIPTWLCRFLFQPPEMYVYWQYSGRNRPGINRMFYWCFAHHNTETFLPTMALFPVKNVVFLWVAPW